MKYYVLSFVFTVLLFCSCHKNKTNVTEPSNVQTEIDSTSVSKRVITEDMAYEGVNNYCHSTYDWSIAEDNPSIMYVEMGEETDSEYQVIFRSYTGAFVYFYVDKKSGSTRIVEYAPTIDVEEEAGVIDLFDYLKKGD